MYNVPSLLYQTRRKNPLVYKGLIVHSYLEAWYLLQSIQKQSDLGLHRFSEVPVLTGKLSVKNLRISTVY